MGVIDWSDKEQRNRNMDVAATMETMDDDELDQEISRIGQQLRDASGEEEQQLLERLEVAKKEKSFRDYERHGDWLEEEEEQEISPFQMLPPLAFSLGWIGIISIIVGLLMKNFWVTCGGALSFATFIGGICAEIRSENKVWSQKEQGKERQQKAYPTTGKDGAWNKFPRTGKEGAWNLK